MDEEAFLRAISAKPDDTTVRLVYADWLDERGDPRAEFVRIQVQLKHLQPGDPTHARLYTREQELRAGFPAYWLARLDPPVWCVVGNIVDRRPNQPDQPILRGTRLFRPNAKIFLADRRHCYALLDPERYSKESVQVIGQHRKSRQWIGCYVSAHLTCNWRVRLIHHPGVLVRLRETGWLGFLLCPNEFECPGERSDVASLSALFEAINTAVHRPGGSIN